MKFCPMFENKMTGPDETTIIKPAYVRLIYKSHIDRLVNLVCLVSLVNGHFVICRLGYLHFAAVSFRRLH